MTSKRTRQLLDAKRALPAGVDEGHAEISLALLTRDADDLRRRVLEAADRAGAIRNVILRAAERRHARTEGRKQVTVQLFAMPLIIDFGDQHTRAKREVTLLGQDPAWDATINRIWRSAFDGDTVDIRPGPTMVHANAALGTPPHVVHEQTFRGASLFEGRQPKPVAMCTAGQQYEAGGGPRAIVYLMLAYVASPRSIELLSAGRQPSEPLAAQYLSAWFAVESGTPSVRILPPKRYYDALNDAQLELLHHFMRWCSLGCYPHRLDLSSAAGETNHVTITGRYQPRGNATQEEVSWSYDCSWRGFIDLAAKHQVDTADHVVRRSISSKQGPDVSFVPADQSKRH